MQEWLEETMQFMAERYPDLTDLQFAQLRMMGERYLEPIIPHGQTHNALNRGEGSEPESGPEGGAKPAVAEGNAPEAPERVASI